MRESQPGIQMYVASVAVQSMQTGFRGLHERLLWLVQHSSLNQTQIMHVVHQRLEKPSTYNMVQRTIDLASKCVSV